MRKLVLVALLAGALLPVASSAAAPPVGPLPPIPVDPPALVITGTFTDFVAPTADHDGSLTILVQRANVPGASVQRYTVALTPWTSISYARGRQLNGRHGKVTTLAGHPQLIAISVIVDQKLSPPPPGH